MESKKIIIEATRRHTKRQIDVSGKGRNIKAIERGNYVSPKKITQLLKRIEELDAGTALPATEKKKNGNADITALADRIELLEVQLHTLTEENKAYSKQILEQQQEILSASRIKRKPRKHAKVLGWTITQKTIGAKGLRYQKYYGTRYINGKQKWVYIGDNPDRAEEKIRAWMQKNGMLA